MSITDIRRRARGGRKVYLLERAGAGRVWDALAAESVSRSAGRWWWKLWIEIPKGWKAFGLLRSLLTQRWTNRRFLV